MNEKYQTHWALPNGNTLIKTDKHKIEAKLLVGADGPFSKVAARFGIKHNLIPATQAYIKMEAPLHQAAMYFNPKWKELFGYVIPEGKNGICRVGLATKQHPNQAFETFLKILHVQPKQIIGRSGGVIPLGFPRRIAFRNTLLIGDSACMVKATTGGGIVMIATASKILITAIEKALHANDFSQEYLVKQYQRPIKNSIGLQLKIHYFIRLVVMALKNYDFNNFFKLYLGTNMGQVLSKNADMDFPLRVVRKLIRNKYFIRFLTHIFIRNWLLIPQFLHDIAL
jgi:flavin-dependent dehydrogenase